MLKECSIINRDYETYLIECLVRSLRAQGYVLMHNPRRGTYILEDIKTKSRFILNSFEDVVNFKINNTVQSKTFKDSYDYSKLEHVIS